MAWFDGIKKISLPGFSVNAFGKLPFYKEYLYLCPDPEFADLKRWVDESFEQLSRQGVSPPYLAPNRHFLVHMTDSRTDLVGSIWDSDDGLRAFPFMIAMALPRKARKHGLPLFWQCLTTVWEYFERYFEHLSDAKSASDFYKRIRGVSHQLPKIAQPDWPKDAPPSEDARANLEGGGLACFDLRNREQTAQAWLRGLNLGQLPNFILWPQSDFKATAHEAKGYVGLTGMETIAVELFQPVPRQDDGLKPAQEALVQGEDEDPNAGFAPGNEPEGDVSETETLVLGGREKAENSSPEPVEPADESSLDETQDEIPGIEEGKTMNLPPLSPIAEELETKEDDIPPSWLEDPTEETLSGVELDESALGRSAKETAEEKALSEAPTMELSLVPGGETSEMPLLDDLGEDTSQLAVPSETGDLAIEDEAHAPEPNRGNRRNPNSDSEDEDQPPTGRRPGTPPDRT